MPKCGSLLIPMILASCSLASGQGGGTVEAGRQVTIPVRSRVTGDPVFSLQAFVYRPAGGGKHPIVLLSHGSSGGDPKQVVPQAELATFFTDRGFVVIAPMRRGRGRSGGTSLESEDKNCDTASWQPGLAAAAEDLTATIDFAAAMPDADAGKIVLVGESRGGFLSVAYAAEGARRTRVKAVVNFVGGWVAQAEDNCPIDFNQVAFQRYGAATRVSELWLYGADDRFYSSASVQSYPRAFRKGGGTVTFDLIGSVTGNGHWLPGFPALWSEQVDRYLANQGLLAGRR